MLLPARIRLAAFTVAVVSALGTPLLAAPAHAAAPVVPSGACVTELAALDAPRLVLADARATQAAAKVVKDAAVAAYLANPTGTTLAARNTARSEYSTLRAETVAAKAARVAVRAVLDACVARGFSASNFRLDDGSFWADTDILVADLVVTGLTPNSQYHVSPQAYCGEVRSLCAGYFTADSDGTINIALSPDYAGPGWAVARCSAPESTNQNGIYDASNTLVRTVEVPIPAGVC